MYDIVMNHEYLKKLDNDKVLELLKRIFPERELYSISVDWRNNKDFILKARGTKGDIIVGWDAAGTDTLEFYKDLRHEWQEWKESDRLKQMIEHLAANGQNIVYQFYRDYQANNLSWESALMNMVICLSKRYNQITQELQAIKTGRPLPYAELWEKLKGTMKELLNHPADLKRPGYINIEELLCYMKQLETHGTGGGNIGKQ